MLSLRLTLPANFFQQSIIAEVDGIDVRVVVDTPCEPRDNSENYHAPQHRKTARRIHSPPPSPHDTGGIPSPKRLARSILLEEPIEDKQELEARYMAKSSSSDFSDESALGTGTSLGLPGVIAAFLQGIIDRAQVKIKNVDLRLSLMSEVPEAPSTILAVNIASIVADSALAYTNSRDSSTSTSPGKRRQISVQGLSVHLLCKDHHSHTHTHPIPSDLLKSDAQVLPRKHEEQANFASFHSASAVQESSIPPRNGFVAEDDLPTSDLDSIPDEMVQSTASFGIRPGEDNISWTSRQSQRSSDHDQIWASFSRDERRPTSDILQDMSSSMFLSTVDAQETLQETAQPPTGHSPNNSQSPERVPGSSPTAQDQHVAMCVDGEELHQSRDDLRELATAVSPVESDDGSDLTKSVVYSHAEAESMYMSAVSHGLHSPDLKAMPGAWGSILDDEGSEPPFLSQNLEDQPGYESEDRASTPKMPIHSPSMRNTSESVFRNAKQAAARYVAKEIFTMQDLMIGIRERPTTESPARNSEDAFSESSLATSGFQQHAPGAFSIYAEGGRSSVRFNAPSKTEEPSSTVEAATVDDTTELTIEVQAAPINMQLDTDTLCMACELLERLNAAFQSQAVKTKQHQSPTTSKVPRLSVHLDKFCIRLVPELPKKRIEPAELPSWRPNSTLDYEEVALLRLEVQQIDLQSLTQSIPTDFNFQIGNLTLTAGTSDVFAFDVPTGRLPGQSDVGRAVSIRIHSKTTLQEKTVKEIDVRLLPIHLNLDLKRFDEDFDALGGLTGVMEMSSSLLSSGMFSHKSDTPPPRKGVRFEDKNMTKKTNQVETKVNVRLERFNARLVSRACVLELQASKTKVISREWGVAAVIDKLSLDMPIPRVSADRSDFELDVTNLTIIYRFSPEEADLGRLLSLVTPSRNKYENDDDILIETMLGQRRKGSVLRLNALDLQVWVHEWTFVPHLKSLGDELSRLSAVAKYLPEDDTPGLLLLAQIGDTTMQVPVNETFGSLKLSFKDMQAAQIGLPALYAFSIGKLNINPVGRDYIVHEMLPDACKVDLPMFMARMVGDEVEPIVKVKLFNICLEYSVPTLLALTSSRTAFEVEQKVQDVAASILEASIQGFGEISLTENDVERSPGHNSKGLLVDILLLDSAIGLKPNGLDAKGILLLENTKFSTTVPQAEPLEATLEVREAALFIVDSESTASFEPNASPSYNAQPNHSLRLRSYLTGKGYVSVSSIRAAQAIVSVTESESEMDKLIDIEFRDELFLLETCADSTQTMIAILNSLSPPALTNDDPKFRTQADAGLMSLDEMVNSFSGETFVKPGPASPALFDAEDDIFAAGKSDSNAEADMIADLSESLERSIGIVDDDLYGEGGLQSDTVESLLEQDPFEMTSSPQLSDDALLRSLRKDLNNSVGSQTATLKPFFRDDRQLDKIFGGSRALGEAHEQQKRFPIQVRVRDVNIIWNLYDGYDWRRTRDTITHAVEEVELKLEERKLIRRRSNDPEEEPDAVIGDCLFNSIYIGVSAARDPLDLRHSISRLINQGNDAASETESYATSGISKPTQASSTRQSRFRRKRLRLQRSKSHKLGFEFQKVSLDFLVHPPGSGEVQSSIDVRVTDFEIFDHVPTSTWKKFLTLHNSKTNPREMMKPMVHVELLNVRPVPELVATEMTIRVSGKKLPMSIVSANDAFRPQSCHCACMLTRTLWSS